MTSPSLDIRERPSPNCEARPAGKAIDTLVLHYTGMETARAALERLCDATSRVSAHYLVDEDGTVWRLVAEDMRAWHAGIAAWQGETDLNDRSIGIELVNPGHELGYRPFPEPQMQALFALCQDIIARHRIPPQRVVGHSDIAPTRKSDPGELFDWPALAARGIGRWPGPVSVPDSITDADRLEAIRRLGAIGYDVAGIAAAPEANAWTAAIAAFQRRYRRSSVTGMIDAETLALIRAVAA